MTNQDELNLVDDVREALLEFGFRPCALRDSVIERKLPVRFDVVKRTQLGRFLILAVTGKRTGARLYQLAVEHPGLLRLLSERLGKPIRIVEEHDGRVSLIITLLPPHHDLERLCPVSAFG